MNSDDDIDVLARTIWAEARGEGRAGMSAVASVIVNRARNPRWWGGPSIASVCQKPWQFRCWNPNDPDRAKLLAVTTDDSAFADAIQLAALACQGQLIDATKGADHYHEISCSPEWTRDRVAVATIGRRRFYRIELAEK